MTGGGCSRNLVKLDLFSRSVLRHVRLERVTGVVNMAKVAYLVSVYGKRLSRGCSMNGEELNDSV